MKRWTHNAITNAVNRLCTSTRAAACWVGLALVVIIAIISYLNLSELVDTIQARARLRPSLNAVNDTLLTALDAETGQRGYLLTGDDAYLDPYRAATEALGATMAQIDTAAVEIPDQRVDLEDLHNAVATKFAELAESSDLMRAGRRDEALEVVTTGGGLAAMTDIRGLVTKLRAAIDDRLEGYDRRVASLSTRTILLAAFGNLSALALFAVMFHDRRRELQRSKRFEDLAYELKRSAEAMKLQITTKPPRQVVPQAQLPPGPAESLHAFYEHTSSESDKEIEALGQQARELANLVETSRVETLLQSDGKIAAMGQLAQELARSVESSRIKTLNQSDKEIKALGKKARDLATSVESSRIRTLNKSDQKIEELGQQARDLATSVESSRIQTLNKSDETIEAMGQKARDLATSVESSRIQTLNKSDETIEAMGQKARDLATSVESSRIQTLNKSDETIEAMGQKARDLATSVESSRIQTLNKSDREIETLGQQARDLAAFVETSRVLTLIQADKEVETLVQQARDLATSVESSRIQTLNQSDNQIEALGQKARDLARSVESSRIQTLIRSDNQIEALVQKAKDLATSVETSRIQTLNQSNKDIRALNASLEQRVVERTAQLEAANQELDSFCYSVSHDLRAPLRAIDGFSRIVLEDYCSAVAAEGKHYLQLVRDNTRQMGRLVDDLLSFARFGRTTISKQWVEPATIVRSCLAELTKEQEGRQVEIVIGELPACEADAALLKQVWTNLLSNALKYTSKQPVTRIEISSRIGSIPLPDPNAKPTPKSPFNTGRSEPLDPGPRVIYFVKDNGAGFDMKYAHKLFGVFQRLHRAADFEGTGVGLAIVQRIVERHGGRIWAESRPNDGALFSFTLN